MTSCESRFDISVPVNELTIDEPAMREMAGADFPPGVPQSARDGTRNNLLSEALLDGAKYPVIRLRATDVVAAGEGFDVGVEIAIKDQVRNVRVPVTLDRKEGAMIASGEFPLKQSELGFKPFSVAMGALRRARRNARPLRNQRTRINGDIPRFLATGHGPESHATASFRSVPICWQMGSVPITSSARPARYPRRKPSTAPPCMIAGCTAMARFFSVSNQYEPEIEWMLPSNIRPTISPFALISGLPELPPTMSLFVERLNGVFMSSLSFTRCQLSGIEERIRAGGALERARQARERFASACRSRSSPAPCRS